MKIFLIFLITFFPQNQIQTYYAYLLSLEKNIRKHNKKRGLGRRRRVGCRESGGSRRD